MWIWVHFPEVLLADTAADKQPWTCFPLNVNQAVHKEFPLYRSWVQTDNLTGVSVIFLQRNPPSELRRRRHVCCNASYVMWFIRHIFTNSWLPSRFVCRLCDLIKGYFFASHLSHWNCRMYYCYQSGRLQVSTPHHGCTDIPQICQSYSSWRQLWNRWHLCGVAKDSMCQASLCIP